MNPVRQATLLVGAFLGLHLILAYWRPAGLWGADMLAYYGIGAQVAFAGLSTVLLVPHSRRWLLDVFARVGDRFERGRHASVVTTLSVVVGAGLLFVAFSSAVHLLGDGYLYIRELDEGIWQRGPRTDRAPLTFFLVRRLHDLGRGVWGDGESTYRLYSYLSGVLFVLVVLWVSRKLGRSRVERVVLAAILLSGGFVQVFFGYVENYALHLVLLLLYLALGVRAIDHRRFPWAPAVVLGVLLALHLAFLSVLPSLAVLVFLCSKVERPWRDAATWGSAVALPAAAMVLAGAGLLAIGFDPLTYFKQDQASHLLPFFSEPGFRQHYRVFSWEHLRDLVNLLLLVALPAALVLIIRARWRRFVKPEIAFSLIASLGVGLFAAVVNPEIGVFRDWDVLSTGAVPLALASALLLARNGLPANVLAEAGIIVCGAAVLHTAGWVGVNASENRAAARFEAALETATLSGHALSYGWESLGSYYFSIGRKEEAKAAYDHATKFASGNPRHWLSLGAILLDSGDTEGAMEQFQKALSMDPGRSDVHNKIGEVHVRRNELPQARESFVRALELDPRNAEAVFNLGTVDMQTKRYADAAREFQRAIELNPKFPEAFANLGSAFYVTGRFQTAIENAEKALALRPDFGDALYLIGASYWQMNRKDEAVRYFRRLLEVDPDHRYAPAVRRLLAGG